MPLEGGSVGRYKILRRLARGGMGTLFLAHDPLLEREVALKLFLGDLDVADARSRFVREARSAAALNHANIVTIHDYGEFPGEFSTQPYIVMEYVDGETLGDVIRRRAPLRTTEKLRWIEELCAGVFYAHRAGIIHRDIKPANLMIDASGRLKVLDFGIARMRGTLASNVTALIGTPGYMAPEQIRGGTIDHRSDLFAIGIVSYELLSYREAFPGDTVHTITYRILNTDPEPLIQAVPQIDPDLAAIVERALQKDAGARFEDAESLAAAVATVRRRLEANPSMDVVHALPDRDADLSGSVGQGTGGARQRARQPGAVAEMTPPSGPRRTDREALARRRVAQIEASVQHARECLESNQLEAAHEACEQALTLDENNGAALELYAATTAAMSRRDAVALIGRARSELERGALAAAGDLLQRARSLSPDLPDAARLDRELRLARVERDRTRKRAEALKHAIWSAQQALEAGDLETALMHAREAIDSDSQNQEARDLEAEALRRLDEDTGAAVLDELDYPVDLQSPEGGGGAATPTYNFLDSEATLLVLPKRPVPQPEPPSAAPPKEPPPNALSRKELPRKELPRKELTAAARKRALALLDGVSAWMSRTAAEAKAVSARLPLRQRRAVVSGVALVVGLAIAGAAWMALRPGAALEQGVLIVDATPWATVTSIEAENGERHPVPMPASTPLALRLPTGTYHVSLAGPPPESESRRIDVRVQATGVTTAPMQQFKALTPEDYFEQYLTAPAPPPESTPQ